MDELGSSDFKLFPAAAIVLSSKRETHVFTEPSESNESHINKIFGLARKHHQIKKPLG